jgi:outer membrane lipoprotein SlyB
MSLQLTGLTVDKQTYPLHTEILSFEAESTQKKDATKVGVGAGIGAVIGAIAGGGKGAAIGAAVGAGAGGATVIATRGKEIKFDPEQRLNFVLRDDVTIKLQ